MRKLLLFSAVVALLAGPAFASCPGSQVPLTYEIARHDVTQWLSYAERVAIVRVVSSERVGPACDWVNQADLYYAMLRIGYAPACDGHQLTFEVVEALRGDLSPMRLAEHLAATAPDIQSGEEPSEFRSIVRRGLSLDAPLEAHTGSFTATMSSCQGGAMFWSDSAYLAFATANGEIFAAPLLQNGADDVLMRAVRDALAAR